MSALACDIQADIASPYDLVVVRALHSMRHIGKVEITALKMEKVYSLLFDARSTVPGSQQYLLLHAAYDEFDAEMSIDVQSTLLDLSVRFGECNLSWMLARVDVRCSSSFNKLWAEVRYSRQVYVWRDSNLVSLSQEQPDRDSGWSTIQEDELEGAASWTWNLQGDVPSSRYLKPQERSRLSDDWDLSMAPLPYRVPDSVHGLLVVLALVGPSVLQDASMRVKARLLEIALLRSDVQVVTMLAEIVPIEHRLLRIWTFHNVLCLWNAYEDFGAAAVAISADLSRLLAPRVDLMRQAPGIESPIQCPHRTLKSFTELSLFDVAILLGDRTMAETVMGCNVRTLVLQLCDITCKYTETEFQLELVYLHVAFGGRLDRVSRPLANSVQRVGALLAAVRKFIGTACGARMMQSLLSALGRDDVRLSETVIRLITEFASSLPPNIWEVYYDLTTK